MSTDSSLDSFNERLPFELAWHYATHASYAYVCTNTLHICFGYEHGRSQRYPLHLNSILTSSFVVSFSESSMDSVSSTESVGSVDSSNERLPDETVESPNMHLSYPSKGSE